MRFEVSLDVYPHWLTIAWHHLIAAEDVHQELVRLWSSDKGQNKGELLETEFAHSMQAMVASAIAVDAFYAAVKNRVQLPASVIQKWRDNKTGRHKQIAEVLRGAFKIGPKSTRQLRTTLSDLFRFRDWAVHPPAEFQRPILHPELRTGTEWRFVAFRFQNAKPAVSNAISTIAQVVQRPKAATPELTRFCESATKLIDPIVTEWEARYGQLYERK